MSLAEERTTAFYRWEVEGRGWRTHERPVVLEPAFVPFPGHGAIRRQAIDDARRASVFELLFGRKNGTKSSAAPVGEQRSPPAAFEHEDLLPEIEILVPADEKIEYMASLGWLTSFIYPQGPVSFELVGRGGQVAIRIAATQRDLNRIRDHLRAIFPKVVTRRALQTTADLWFECNDGIIGGTEFALMHEFMLPLNEPERGQDLFTPLLALLGRIGERELAVFQVMFQPAAEPWGGHALAAVYTPSGQPFFEDGKDVTALAMEKCAEPLYAAVIRAIVSAETQEGAEDLIYGLRGAMDSVGNPSRNQLNQRDVDDLTRLTIDVLTRNTHRSGMILSLSDLSHFVHLPSPSVRAECLLRPSTKTKAAPGHLSGPLIVGINEHDGVERQVGLSVDARLRHCYTLGASGTGKSTLLLSMITQDINAGHGVAVLDPHGDLIDDIIVRIPENRTGDVILLDPADEEFPVGFNVLSAHSELEKTLLSSDLVAVFRRLSTSFGDQMVTVLGNAVLAFLESSEGGTLIDLRRFLLDKAFRTKFLETVADDHVRSYWRDEYPLLKGGAHAPILTRLNTFLRPKIIRHMVAQKQDRLGMRAIMDGRKILLAKLSQGAIGEDNSHLLGSLIVARIAQAAMSRQNERAENRVPFFAYIDECHHYVTPSIATILTGARKYGVGLTLSHQDLRQLRSRSEEVASAALGNAFTRVMFRVAEQDARTLADGLSFFQAKDLMNLKVGEAIARVERADHDFNLRTIPATKIDDEAAERRRAEVREKSRSQFAMPRAEIAKLLTVAEPQRATPSTAEHTRVKASTAEDTSADRQPGRGGAEHKYVQDLVRRIAEERGFTVTIEKRVFDGHGHIDVALEREGLSIGCEISVSTRATHEAGNLAKCLAAGFDYAVLITTKERVRRTARAMMGDADSSKMKFVTPEGFYILLEELAGPQPRSRSRKRTNEKPEAPKMAGGLISAYEAAKYLGIETQTLAKMRLQGTSPQYFKVGRPVYYKLADLDSWIAERRRTSTSDRGLQDNRASRK